MTEKLPNHVFRKVGFWITFLLICIVSIFSYFNTGNVQHCIKSMFDTEWIGPVFSLILFAINSSIMVHDGQRRKISLWKVYEYMEALYSSLKEPSAFIGSYATLKALFMYEYYSVENFQHMSELEIGFIFLSSISFFVWSLWSIYQKMFPQIKIST